MKMSGMDVVAGSLLISALSLTSACSSGDDPGDLLVGRWESANQLSVVDFNEDGKVSFDQKGVVQTGTYTINESRLTVDFRPNIVADIRQMATSIYVDESRMAFPAALPEGEVDGVLGKWKFDVSTEYKDNGEIKTLAQTWTLNFKPDQTVSIVYGGKFPIIEQGIYEVDGETVVVMVDKDVDVYTLLNGEALAEENDVANRL